MQLESVAILVDDYDDAIVFFVDALGFELIEDTPSSRNDDLPKRWVVVRPPGATTAMCSSTSPATSGTCSDDRTELQF